MSFYFVLINTTKQLCIIIILDGTRFYNVLLPINHKYRNLNNRNDAKSRDQELSFINSGKLVTDSEKSFVMRPI